MPADGVFVLDACALIALLQREPGAEVIAALLNDDENRCVIHSINVCEVYYDIIRRDGEEDAAFLEELLTIAGIEIVETMSAELWRTAGKLKARWRRVSLADCFALSLALQEGGTFVTSDHHELDRIADADICQILFIR